MNHLKHSIDEKAHGCHVFTVGFCALLRDVIQRFLTNTGSLTQQKILYMSVQVFNDFYRSQLTDLTKRVQRMSFSKHHLTQSQIDSLSRKAPNNSACSVCTKRG